MHTVSDIIADIDRGCMANNMVEDRFSYRIVYFVNENGRGTKHYADASYGNLRQVLENIIRGNLTTTNTVVIAAATARKSGETVSLLGRAYAFNLSGYFRKICEEREKGSISNNYGSGRVNWC